jgi:hypothetical protein
LSNPGFVGHGKVRGGREKTIRPEKGAKKAAPLDLSGRGIIF